ncbi:MAG: hypothetical protein GY928_28130 [Colwellia sp.]|nr:hypothetical protein [Colwellia sp.]
MYILRLKGYISGHSFYSYLEDRRCPDTGAYLGCDEMCCEKFKSAEEFETLEEASHLKEKYDRNNIFEIVPYTVAENQYYV